MEKRTLAIGDIHGNYEGLLQCLERCQFDNENDTLISLGDVVDGHSQSFEVVEKLLSIKNLIAIKGNHDDWFNQWIVTGFNPSNWKQGQKATGLSYLKHSRPDLDWYEYITNTSGTKGIFNSIKVSDVPDNHIEFFKNQLPYYLDNDNNLFVHGGFNRHERLEEQGDLLWWDRDLWSQALSYGSMADYDLPGHAPGYQPPFKMVGNYNEVFIGHTSTQFWGEENPMNAANIWNLDTGAGWFGKLTIMDVKTKGFWQSDKASELYPEFKGRK
jgi:serine/threonine protein phosphatase 1